MQRAIELYSEGFKLQGDIYLPGGLASGETRSAILLCHGYTGVKDLYLPDNARVLNEAGYVVMPFDYKGWAVARSEALASRGWSPGCRDRMRASQPATRGAAKLLPTSWRVPPPGQKASDSLARVRNSTSPSVARTRCSRFKGSAPTAITVGK